MFKILQTFVILLLLSELSAKKRSRKKGQDRAALQDDDLRSPAQDEAALQDDDWHSPAQDQADLQDSDWLLPTKPLWSRSDGLEIKEFYDKYVAIDENEWKTNVKHVNYLLSYITGKIREGSISHPEIDFQRYIRQGSSNEGLKVNSCNEFDVVIPFEFPSVKVKVHTTGNHYKIPTGYAEIEFIEIPSDLRKEFSKLIESKKGKQQKGKELLSTKRLHDTKFKSIFDKVLNKIKSKIVTQEKGGKTVTYSIKRKSNAPSITLNVAVTETAKSTTATTNVSIDFIPGFVYYEEDSRLPKLLVPKWIPESKSPNLKREFIRTDTIWKISFYKYESMFVERSRSKKGADFLITAFRILKGLKIADKARNPSSQFSSVMSTYYLKNVLLYSLLFLQQSDTKDQISSVTEGLGCLVGMLHTAIHKRNLPKFFIGNPHISEIMTEDLPTFRGNARMNIFLELTETALDQAKKDLGEAMQHFGIPNESLKKTAFKVKFEKYLDNGDISKHDEL